MNPTELRRIRDRNALWGIDAHEYWNAKYRRERAVWGPSPSACALAVANLGAKRGQAATKTLDLACGYGRDTAFLAARGFDCDGVDFSEESIALARARPTAVRFALADARALPFADLHFDVVFANYLLQWLDAPARRLVVQEAYRVTAVGGIAVFAVPRFGRSQDPDMIFELKGLRYTKCDALSEFAAFADVVVNDAEEHHDHGTPHAHAVCLIHGARRDSASARAGV